MTDRQETTHEGTAPTGQDRLGRLRPEELSEDQRLLYDQITGRPRGQGPQPFPLTDPTGGLYGPFNAMLLSPPAGEGLARLGAAVRFQNQTTARIQEMAILAVAAHWDSAFERYAHEAIGRGVGLTDAELTALREQHELRLDDPGEAAALATVRALLDRADLTDEEYQAASHQLGERVVFELITLVGFYASIALQLRVYRVPVPAQT